jgi:4-hydroxy-tetrahydrodipicolinate reductase
MSAAPIRVLIWGPGGLGNAAIREVLRRPEFELVGVLAYSEAKNGVDAGILAGADSEAGIAATTSLEAAVATDTDVVLHVARDFGRYGDVPKIAEFLRAGRNVVSVHPYQHPEAMGWTSAPEDVVDTIEAAAALGNATFTATGIHPEWVADRMAPTLTGICSDIKHVTMYENWDMSHYDSKTLSVIGFGKDPTVMESNPAVAQMTNNYCLQNLYGLASGLGVTLDRTEVEHEYASAPADLEFWSMKIPQGTVGRLTHTWHGYLVGADRPFLSVEVNWMMGRAEMVPAGMNPTDYYGVRIEGTPSVAMGISIMQSLEDRSPSVITGDPSSEPGYYGTIAACLQAIPRAVTAQPGWLGPVRPEVHWAPDLRALAHAKATV